MAWPTREEWTTLLREQETEYESSTDATLARYVKAILARFEPLRAELEAAREDMESERDLAREARGEADRLLTLALPLALLALDARDEFSDWNNSTATGEEDYEARARFVGALESMRDLVDGMSPAQRARLRGA